MIIYRQKGKAIAYMVITSNVDKKKLLNVEHLVKSGYFEQVFHEPR